MRYSALALPLAFCGMPLYIHAPDFYATSGYLSLGSIAFILLAIRLFDAIQDPWIGVLSDRFASHLTAILIGAMVTLVLSFWFLFHPPHGAGGWWFGICIVFATTAFSVVTINFQALGAIWSHDTHEKSRIAAYRESIGLVGLLFAAAIPSVLKNQMPAADAFHWVALLFGAIMVVAAWLFFQVIRGSGTTLQRRNASGFRFSHLRHYSQFFLVYALSALATAIPAVLVLFFIRDYLHAEEWTGLYLALYFLAGALGMPFWLRFAKEVGPAQAWADSMMTALGAFIFAYVLMPGDVVAYGVVCVVSGFALGAELALPPAWLAAQLETDSRTQHASSYFALLTFFGKAALAVASGVFLLTLDAANFTPGAENQEAALSTLHISY